MKCLLMLSLISFLIGGEQQYHGVIKSPDKNFKVIRNDKVVQTNYLFFGDTIIHKNNSIIIYPDPYAQLITINDSTKILGERHYEKISFISITKDYIKNYFAPIEHVNNDAISLRSIDNFYLMNRNLPIPVDKNYSIRISPENNIDARIIKQIHEHISDEFNLEIREILHDSKTMSMKIASLSIFFNLVNDSNKNENHYKLDGYQLLIANQKHFKSDEEKKVYINILYNLYTDYIF